MSKAEILGLVAELPLKFRSGEFSAYDNTGYCLLGMMIETVTGRSYATALQERIFTPLGMTATRMNDPREIVPHRAAGYQWDSKTSALRNKPYYSPSGHREGYARDLVNALGSWSVEPEDITVPVDLWYGGLDTSTVHSPEFGATLASRLPNAYHSVNPEEGGAILWTRYWDILAKLKSHVSVT